MNFKNLLKKYRIKYEQNMMFAKGSDSIYNSFSARNDETITH